MKAIKQRAIKQDALISFLILLAKQVEQKSMNYVGTGHYNLITKLTWIFTMTVFGWVQFSSLQFSHSVMFDFLWTHESQHTRPPCPSPTPDVHSRFMSIKSVMPSSYLILSHPLLLLPSIPPSIRVFSNESTLRMRWPKYWSFSFSIIPSKEIPGLISFRMDWLDLLAVQGTLKSLLQHHSSKA